MPARYPIEDLNGLIRDHFNHLREFDLPITDRIDDLEAVVKDAQVSAESCNIEDVFEKMHQLGVDSFAMIEEFTELGFPEGSNPHREAKYSLKRIDELSRYIVAELLASKCKCRFPSHLQEIEGFGVLDGCESGSGKEP